MPESSEVAVQDAEQPFEGKPWKPGVPAPGSLEARISERRDALEQATSETFDVPRYEGILRVELRAMGTKQQFQIIESAQRISGDYAKAMFVGAELIARATLAFYAVDKETGEDLEAEGFSWLAAAQAKWPELGEDTAPRVAMLRLLGDEGVSDLAQEWRTWMRSRGQKLDAQLERDFS